MATISAVRGILLEEIILFLLKTSGYKTIEDPRSDPEVLRLGAAGMEVNGRGGKHQIDAIADFHISAPFSYPQRLLLEGKCYSDKYKVGIPIVRNAVGVLKDVSEFWVTRTNGVPAKTRYHYQYSIFSTSGFTKDAEKYAYAQDIYLINLHKSHYFKPIISAIRAISHTTFGSTSWNDIEINLSEFRKVIRRIINDNEQSENLLEISTEINIANFNDLFFNCRQLGSSYLAMISRRFPVFLAPSPEFNYEMLRQSHSVRIRWDNQSWYLYTDNDIKMFSFDLPTELFTLYETEGLLNPERALDLKQEMMSEIQLIINREPNQYYRGAEIISLYLDQNWIQEIRNRIQE